MSDESGSSVSADEGAILGTLRNLWAYMWPEGRPDLRRRAVLAIGALLLEIGRAHV